MVVTLIILSYLFIGSNFVRWVYLTKEYENEQNKENFYFLELVLWPLNILLYLCKIIFIIITYILEKVKKRNAIDLILYLYNKVADRYNDSKC